MKGPMQWMGLMMLWNDSKEDGHVRSECMEGEGNDCDNRDSDTDW